MPGGQPIGELEGKWISSTLRRLDPLLKIWMDLQHELDGDCFNLKEEVYCRICVTRYARRGVNSSYQMVLRHH